MEKLKKKLTEKLIKRVFNHSELIDEIITDFKESEEFKQLILSGVSQQRELLVDFWMNLPNTNKNKTVAKHYVDKYLESTNCG